MQQLDLPSSKVILLGNTSVGKTVLFYRLVTNQVEEPQPTISPNLSDTVLQTEDGRSVKVQIWDTAGQERFKSLVPAFIRDAKAALLVYDVTNPLSEEGIDFYYDLLVRELDRPPVVVIVGNKCDLRDQLEYSVTDADRMIRKANDLNVELCEVSALTGHGIAGLTELLARRLSEGMQTDFIKADLTVRQEKRKCCA